MVTGGTDTVLRVLAYLIPTLVFVCCCFGCAMFRQHRQYRLMMLNSQNLPTHRHTVQNRAQRTRTRYRNYGSFENHQPPSYDEIIVGNPEDKLPTYETAIQKL